MGRCRGCEPRPRIFSNSVRLALKQQVRNLATQSKEKALERKGRGWGGGGHRAGCREQGTGSHPPTPNPACLSPVSPLSLSSPGRNVL